MIFNGIFGQFFYAIAIALGHSPLVSTSQAIESDSEEVLSYNCGRSIASIVERRFQLGPSLLAGDFLLTSVVANDETPLLIVNSKTGLFVSVIDQFTVNHIQFQMPDGVDNKINYYLKYSFGREGQPRLYQFSSETPPAGHENDYFKKINLRRAPQLTQHFNFSTFKTVENIVKSVAQGKIKKERLQKQDFTDCDRLKLKSPSLGMAIEFQLKQLYEFPSKNDQLRAPASFN